MIQADNPILVSVVVPVYKIKEEYLRACVGSLLEQSLKEIEIILVDDGSPDVYKRQSFTSVISYITPGVVGLYSGHPRAVSAVLLEQRNRGRIISEVRQRVVSLPARNPR